MLDRMAIFKTLDTEIKKQKGLASVKRPYTDHKSLKDLLGRPKLTVIAEVAGGNPLCGRVRASYKAATHAKGLLDSGAAALSVATDIYCYGGQDKHLPEVRGMASCPLIRRDFIFEEFQVEESKALGADAIYLTAPVLDPERMGDLLSLANSKKLDVIVEAFSQEDIENALDAGAQIICVVGRDVETWEVVWGRVHALLKLIPKKCLKMVEAGVMRLQQLKELESLGVHGVIIGDALLNDASPGRRLAQLLSGKEPPAKPQKEQKADAAKDAKAKDAPKKATKPAAKLATAAKKAAPAKPVAKPAAKPVATAGKTVPTTKSAAKHVAAKTNAKPAPAAKKAAPAKNAPPVKKSLTGSKVAKVVQGAKAPASKTATPHKTAPPPQRPSKGIKETSMATTKKADKATTADTEKKAAAPKKATAKKATAPKKPAVKKAAPKKATAAKKPVKSTVKKAAPKKATAAKKPVKSTVKKAAPKKTTASKTVKKVVSKKAAPKKTTAATKPAVKKAAPKKATAKSAKVVKKVAPKTKTVKTTSKKPTAAKKHCAPKVHHH